MGKFKEDMLVTGAKAEQERRREQEKLRKKHQVSDEEVLIVEKTNMVKFLVRCMARLIQITARIILFVLAAVGVIALLYPDVRVELFQVFQQILTDIRQML